ncbi:hypothetical protein RchiOBHm_Chr7g0201051 [Rosa chinensis]|uniref:Uncharacterized protein n=1 Tax=Rosa chinensis TaxID=74649 RepID=A0A2P6P7V3_ROSCH|nr:hypothetical protein RchiOBHm_Chr7g0201051 [Rosa chinensis]
MKFSTLVSKLSSDSSVSSQPISSSLPLSSSSSFACCYHHPQHHQLHPLLNLIGMVRCCQLPQ